MRRLTKFESLESRDLLSINPVLVKDIGANVSSSDVVANSSGIEEFFEFKDEVYFRANDGSHGSELWKTDGTTSGTVMVKDINPTSSSTPRNFVESNGQLFFVADGGGTDGQQLWRTDGTAAGTSLVKDLNFGVFPPEGDGIIGSLGGDLIFVVGNDSTANLYDLWKTNGTVSGTVELKEFSSGDENRFYGVSARMTYEFNGEWYFETRDATSGFELWKTDGTTGGTQLVGDLNPGLFSSAPTQPIEMDGMLYLIADTWDSQTESLSSSLFKTDGTEAGTERITPYGMQLDRFVELVAHHGSIYFATSGGADDTAPYRSDGTAAGTVQLASPNGVENSEVWFFAEALDQVIFVWLDREFDGIPEATLWITDGAAASTIQLTDAIVPSGGFQWVEHDGNIYYPTFGTAPDVNDSLGRSDGTTGGTVLLSDAGIDWKVVRPKSVLDDGRILMVGRIRSTGPEYWLFDPATETYEVIEIAPGDFGAIGESNAYPFEYEDSLLFVAAGNAQQGDELWVMDIPTSNRKPGDIDGDGSVGFADFLLLSQNFGKVSDAVWADGDFDGDGTVGFADFLLLSQNFGIA